MSPVRSPPRSSPLYGRGQIKSPPLNVLPKNGLTGYPLRGKSLKRAFPFDKHIHDGGGTSLGPQSISPTLFQKDDRGPLAFYRTIFNYSDRTKFSRIVVDDCLIFDANFESGNLLSAKRVYFGDCRDNNRAFQEYDLEMHPDLNCHSGSLKQWFFFSIACSCSFPSEHVKVKINITNFSKSNSLYTSGMKPLLYTEATGWKRIGDDIGYFPSKERRGAMEGGREKQMYTLSFTFDLTKSADKLYIAPCYPYTYFDLQEYLYDVESNSQTSQFVHRTMLCKTLAGNRCDLVTITGPSSCKLPLRDRKVIVITGRVHPGESCASWIVQGILEFLLGTSTEAGILRSKYVFKIIPMLNPDGVINGSYRCSLAGNDLNRCWDSPDAIRHPTIYKAKEMVRNLKMSRDVALLCDLHGHSRKKGCFVFGCIPTHQQDLADHDVYKFPRLYDGKSHLFSFDKCTFQMSNHKMATMRMVMYEELGIQRAYTLEASLSGNDEKHFSNYELIVLGQHFCHALVDFSIYDEKIPPLLTPRSPMKENTNQIRQEAKEKQLGLKGNFINQAAIVPNSSKWDSEFQIKHYTKESCSPKFLNQTHYKNIRRSSNALLMKKQTSLFRRGRDSEVYMDFFGDKIDGKRTNIENKHEHLPSLKKEAVKQTPITENNLKEAEKTQNCSFIIFGSPIKSQTVIS